MENTFDFDKGQHILIDRHVLEKEIEAAGLNKKDKVIEIGAGTGNLTEELCKKAGKVLAFEIDEKFRDKLIELGEKHENLIVIFDNALNYKWKDYNKTVSNIPYYLSEEIVSKAIAENIKELVLIIGDNFRELLFSDSKIGLIARKFYSIEEIMKVSKESFKPIPRVDSALIRMKKKGRINRLDKTILDIVFAKGKLKNALVRALLKLGKTKRQSKDIVNKINLDDIVLEKPAKMITDKLLLRIESEFGKIID